MTVGQLTRLGQELASLSALFVGRFSVGTPAPTGGGVPGGASASPAPGEGAGAAGAGVVRGEGSFWEGAAGAVRASREFPKTVATAVAVSATIPSATTELVLMGTAGSIQSRR